MKFKGKEIRVILSENAHKQYIKLNRFAKQESENSVHHSLLKSVERVIEMLKKDPFKGEQIRKKMMPKSYIRKYGIDNLWRIELSNYWRMLYTIKGGSIEIINFILDIVDHKKYNKIFGYN